MAEAVTTTAAVAAAATVGGGLLAVAPWLGDYGIVALSAFAAALVQLGARSEPSVRAGIALVLRVMVVSLALAGAITAMVLNVVDLKLGTAHLLAIVSFALGLADGNWKAIGKAIGAKLLRLLPDSRGSTDD